MEREAAKRCGAHSVVRRKKAVEIREPSAKLNQVKTSHTAAACTGVQRGGKIRKKDICKLQTLRRDRTSSGIDR